MTQIFILQSGKYEAECVASSKFETSNTVNFTVSVLSETTSLDLTASKVAVLPNEEIDFIITFTASDEFTCYTFDAGDGSDIQAFGNENTCKEFLKDQRIKYNSRGSKR